MRDGLFVRGNNVHPEVRRSVIQFARWMRLHFKFPIRVPVYLSPNAQIVTKTRKRVSASFFAPYDRSLEPYIRVATGDYIGLRTKHGPDDALAAILCSVAHEIVHYQQWIQGKETREREAVWGAQKILRAYAKAVLHP